VVSPGMAFSPATWPTRSHCIGMLFTMRVRCFIATTYWSAVLAQLHGVEHWQLQRLPSASPAAETTFSAMVKATYIEAMLAPCQPPSIARRLQRLPSSETQ